MNTYEEMEVQFHIFLVLSLNGSKCMTSRCSFFSPGQNCSEIQRNFIFSAKQIETNFYAAVSLEKIYFWLAVVHQVNRRKLQPKLLLLL